MLNSKDEEPVWECCLRWIEHDPDGRREYVQQLLQGVRLGLLHSKVKYERFLYHFNKARISKFDSFSCRLW